MDEIFNFAKQQMSTYSDRFGAVNPMQQDIAWGCNGCTARCAGNCSGGCQGGCHHGCNHTCYHACDSSGMGTKRRGW